DMLTPSYRPRPLHSTSSSRDCISMRSTYTPSSSITTSISSSRKPTPLRRRASEATVTTSPSLSSYSVSSYSRYRPTGGTLIDLPTVDPYDIPRRYRSSYDRDDYKRSDYASARSDYSTSEHSRQDSGSDRYKIYRTEPSSDISAHRERSYSIDKDRYRSRDYSTPKERVETKDEVAAFDVALRKTEAVAEASFEMVIIKKEFTAVAESVREIRNARKEAKPLEEKEMTVRIAEEPVMKHIPEEQ
ncbi:hypothetical protein PENTCL1PPCAC_10450, partial [Pristionchus entomophagus]